jgi:hypothetical protein
VPGKIYFTEVSIAFGQGTEARPRAENIHTGSLSALREVSYLLNVGMRNSGLTGKAITFVIAFRVFAFTSVRLWAWPPENILSQAGVFVYESAPGFSLP